MLHGHQTNAFYRFLVTPTVILGPYSQAIGTVRGIHEGAAYFSPNGSRYAWHSPDTGLEAYDFDRCTGLLSNPVWVSTFDSVGDGGLAFSSNSNVLYASTGKYVFQLNLAAGSPAAVAASKQIVAEWDGTYDPLGWPFAAILKAELAPDGKIYLTTGSCTIYLHQIHQPDNLGLACNLTQHSVQLPTLNVNTLPNHPNYHLDALAGSPCDTLVSAATEPVKQLQVQLYPNPNSGAFSLSFAPQPEPGQLLVYNVPGKPVHQEPIAPWSQVKRLSLPQLPPGVYHCRLIWKGKSGVVRFVKIE